ncbi:SagB/ThcOx family dehydrogenase [Hyalangium versicolor]|uniref:SagB/ThcOx family dehydrogenase n=1 Tax=Hyalangium versicolor TaxID=2861190 RepID=UPI001CCDA517|nr:SagB family peptide dehydrogenase [Hyalangium versicolor]
MSTRETISWGTGVSVSLAADGRREITGRVELTLPPVSPSVGAALEALSEGDRSFSELSALAGHDGVTHAAIFHSLLEGLRKQGLLARTLHVDGSVIARLAPAAPQARGHALKEGVRYSLSRFAFMHVVDGSLMLETPLSEGRVELSAWQGPALLGALATPRCIEDVTAAVPGLPTEAATAFLRMLAEAGLLTETGADGVSVEPGVLATWEFHDLLFHRQTRWGKRESIYGGATYRFRDVLPAPEKKPPLQGERFSLEKPDLSEVERRDPPFSVVMEGRRSIRAHGARPVTRTQLGELLYRAVGHRHVVFHGRGEGEARPYPSGGAIYETEVYVIVERCEGLEEGLYHYQGAEHALCRISGRTPELDMILQAAMSGALIKERPQVMIILTARFARMAWKYETMAYAAMLKNVGVIYQTLYLVATAMGLAPCALGGGSAEVFARASGLDPLEEGSVGEFLLGTRPE